MIPSVISQPAPPSHGKPNSRFYNKSLEHVYRTCLLPTKTPHAAAHTICSSMYEKSTVCKKTWKQALMTPPSVRSPSACCLSSPFATLASSPSAVGAVDSISNKRPRLQDLVDPQPPPEAEQEPVKRKLKPFHRKNALTGQLRTYKVLMKLTTAQREEFERCFAVGRLYYNKANALVKQDTSYKNFQKLRNELLAKRHPGWETGVTSVARAIKGHAIKQLIDSYKTNDAKNKKNNKNATYVVKDRRLNTTDTEVIGFEKNKFLLSYKAVAVRSEPLRGGRAECNVFFGSNMQALGPVRVEDSMKTVRRMVAEGEPREGAKIQWDKRTKKFYLLYVFEQPALTDDDPQFLKKRVVATDPGASPFHAYYSPASGEYGELLEGARSKFENRCLKIDALQMRIAKRNGKPPGPGRTRRQRNQTTRTLIIKLAKDRRRLHGWMANAHYDAANFLLTRYDVVIEPKLATSKLVLRNDRVFGAKTARAMYTWSHYLFRQRLKSASSRYAGRHVIECNEPGTSKTCGNCGFWNADLGGKKTYACPHCLFCRSKTS